MKKPVLKQFGGLTVYGYSTQTRNADERDSETAKIPALWQTLFSSLFMPHEGMTWIHGWIIIVTNSHSQNTRG